MVRELHLVISCCHYDRRSVIVEQTRLEHQEHLENLKKAQETFEIWKAQKDLEQQLAQEGNADNSVELKSEPIEKCI